MSRVCRASGKTTRDRPAQAGFTSTQESAAAVALKSSVPTRQRQANPNRHMISGWRMRHGGRDPAHAIGSIDDDRLNRRVRQRDILQAFGRAHRRDAREKWFGRSFGGADERDDAEE